MQDTPDEMGPLSFRRGSHRVDLGRTLDISAKSEAKMRQHAGWKDHPVSSEPFALGDVSFHSGWTFHGAMPNESSSDRLVMTMIYFADGTTLAEPTTDAQRSLLINYALGGDKSTAACTDALALAGKPT